MKPPLNARCFLAESRVECTKTSLLHSFSDSEALELIITDVLLKTDNHWPAILLDDIGSVFQLKCNFSYIYRFSFIENLFLVLVQALVLYSF